MTHAKTIWIGLVAGLLFSAAVGAWAGIGPEGDTNDVYWDDQFALAGTDSAVRAVAMDASGNVYVGGTFRVAGDKSTSRIAKWDKATSKWTQLGTGMNNTVNALVIDAAGNLYAGGTFVTVDGAAITGVAKWNGTAWSPLGTGLNGAVSALALDNSGNLYAGGWFTTADGLTVNRVAKWTGSAWSPLGSGTDKTVNALAVDDFGNVYVAGAFTTAGGVAANHIAKWSATTSTWSPLGSGITGSSSMEVSSLAADHSGSVYIGGSNFTSVGGVTTSCFAKWDGIAWSASGFASGSVDEVYALAVDTANNLYVGGDLREMEPGTYNNLAKWDGTTWSILGSNMRSSVQAIAPNASGSIAIGGLFGQVQGVGVSNVALWDGTQWRALGTGIGGVSLSVVTALVADTSGNVYAGGDFTSIDGVSANYVARWNGKTWLPLGTGVDGSVLALALDRAGNLYAGGTFMKAGGSSALGVAKWNGASWSRMGSYNDAPYALTTDAFGNVYAGTIRVEKWNGSFWTVLGGDMDAPIYAVAADSAGNVYAGGIFSTIGGVTAKGIAKWNGSVWSAMNTGITAASIRALLFDASGNLYAGGSYVLPDSTAFRGIIKWDGASWSKVGTSVGGTLIHVLSLAMDNSGIIYAGGTFTTAGGLPANGVARWDGTSWSAMGTGIAGFTSWPYVQAVTVQQNALVAGGQFYFAGGKVSAALAEWQPRVNHNIASISASPGAVTLGDDAYGFYKPALTTTGATTVSYSGGFPVAVTMDRAGEIQAGGIRVNGAVTLTPEGVRFGGSGATLRVEFSEDDAAAYSVPYTDFVAVKMTYPTDYPASKEAASYTSLGGSAPTPIRVENGKQIYAITAPLPIIGSTYGAVPKSFHPLPAPPMDPAAADLTTDAITWTWQDYSGDETGFKAYDDPGANPPATLRTATAANTTLWRHSELSANTQYAFQVCATNGNGDSAKTSPVTAWTLLEAPLGLIFGNVSATAMQVTIQGTFSNLAIPQSGLRLANTTLGTDNGWQSSIAPWTNSGLTPNTPYTFSGTSRNAAMAETLPFTATKYTLSGPPSIGNNVSCDQPTGVPRPAGTAFTFSNPAGFGPGAHGGSIYRVDRFKYAWDTSATSSFTGSEPDWNTGTLAQTPSASGSYYLHLESLNAEGAVGGVSDYGPFVLDAEAPTADFRLQDTTPTGRDQVHFAVDFSESVGTTFDASDVTVTGTLSGTPSVTGASATYSVTVALADPSANGTIGIQVGSAVSDLDGNAYLGGPSGLYTILNWPGFAVEPANTRKYTGDAHTFSVSLATDLGSAASYQWKWKDADDAIHDGPTMDSWSIAAISPASQGSYWCKLTYDDTTYNTTQATLAVVNHLQITKAPEDAEAMVGSAHTFNVETIGGFTPLNYLWYKDGEPIDGATTPSYTRLGLKFADAGVYQVEVSDAHADMQSATADLTVMPGVPAANTASLICGVLAVVVLGALRFCKSRKLD